jgi:hypothetical protein
MVIRHRPQGSRVAGDGHSKVVLVDIDSIVLAEPHVAVVDASQYLTALHLDKHRVPLPGIDRRFHSSQRDRFFLFRRIPVFVQRKAR